MVVFLFQTRLRKSLYLEIGLLNFNSPVMGNDYRRKKLI